VNTEHIIDRSDSLLEQLVHFACVPETDHEHHSRAFTDWLALDLEQQHDELREYFAHNPDAGPLVRRWIRERRYENLVPAGAKPAEKDLFLSDFRIVATLLSDDLLAEEETPEPAPGRPAYCGNREQRAGNVHVLATGVAALFSLLPVARFLSVSWPTRPLPLAMLLAAEGVVCAITLLRKI